MSDMIIDFMLMSGNAYFKTRSDDNNIPVPEEWTLVGNEHRWEPSCGFEAAAYQQGDTIVISYAGTYPGTVDGEPTYADIVTDVSLGYGTCNDQLKQAALFYMQTKAAHPEANNFIFTGHSLGGGLAALMAVFFDRPAYTFNQAPFRRAATESNRDTLIDFLKANGFPFETLLDLRKFSSFSVHAVPLGGLPMDVSNIRGESNVVGFATQGEFLTPPPYGPQPLETLGVERIGRTTVVTHSNTAVPGTESSVSALDLHAIELSIALRQCPDLRSIGSQLPWLLPSLFDKGLFANETKSSTKNLFTHLIRYEFGIPGDTNSKKGLLSKFSADAALVANLGTDDMDLKQGLMQLAKESYYNTVTSTGKRFFESAGNGIRFDLAGDIGDSPVGAGSLKGYAKLKNAILSHVSADATAEVTQYLNESRRITLVFGKGGGADAEDDATGDYMMLGANGGWLNGKGGDDLLVGGNGMDAFTGGAGDDTLIGGNGIDSYLYKAGDGDDTVIDSDKKGRIFIISADGKTTYAASIFTKDKNNPGNYQSADGLGRCRRAKLSVRGTGLRGSALNGEWRKVA